MSHNEVFRIETVDAAALRLKALARGVAKASGIKQPLLQNAFGVLVFAMSDPEPSPDTDALAVHWLVTMNSSERLSFAHDLLKSASAKRQADGFAAPIPGHLVMEAAALITKAATDRLTRGMPAAVPPSLTIPLENPDSVTASE